MAKAEHYTGLNIKVGDYIIRNDSYQVAPVEKARYGDEMNQRLGQPPLQCYNSVP